MFGTLRPVPFPSSKPPVSAARGADGSQVPTKEVGSPAPNWNVAGLDSTFGFTKGIPWSYFDEREESPELQWQPGNQGSNRVYASMLGDAQVRGLLMATTNPIRRFMWSIDPNGARTDVAKHISASLNLPLAGEEDSPRRGGFNHDRFLAQALQALAYGHYYFERVYERLSSGRWALQGLYTRPPRTIINFVTDPHGALAGIIQLATGTTDPMQVGLGGIPIDANRLLPFVWEPNDDGDWVGRAMLRPIYKNWLVKDRLVRLDVLRHERNSMGVPWVESHPGASKEEIASLAAIAEEVRASQRGGGAGPGKLTLQGVTGKASDPVESIRYHDQQMTSAFLAMFIELGRGETGSYALGQALVDFHSEMIGTVADWYVATMQAQIEDEVLINWGPDEQPPRLSYTRLETAELAFADLALGVEKGLIAADPELRAYIGERWKVPGQSPEEIEAHEETEAEKAEEKAEAFGLPAGGEEPVPETDEKASREATPETDEAKPKAAADEMAKRYDATALGKAERAAQPRRSALASQMLAALTGPMTWADLARAVGREPKDGTARRARDLLVAEGAMSHNGRRVAPLAGLQLPDRELRRNPTPIEVSAAVNFAEMERVHVDLLANLTASVKAAQAAQVAELAGAVEAAAGDVAKLGALQVEPVSLEVLVPILRQAARAGEASAQQEYEAQIAAVPVAAAQPSESKVDAKVEERAKAASLTLAMGMATSASTKASQVAALPPVEAAAKVREHLNGLSEKGLASRLSGAVQGSYNAGRFEVIRAREPQVVYASELLDNNTCQACSAEDGTEWATIAEAEADYPGAGGYVECEGGDRCRGTAIATYV